MKPQKIRRYGWVPDLPNHQDRHFQLGHQVLPDVVDLEPLCPPVYDQGSLGSCSANAVASAFDFERKAQGLEYMTPSRLFLYYNARALDGSVAWDNGSSLRNCVKGAVKIGVCSEDRWRYDIARFTEQPPAEAYADAEQNQALEYRRILASETDMMSCLGILKRPFVFGFSVFSFFESDEMAQTGMLRLPEDSEELEGGHAVKAVGYDRIKRLFKVRNSWSQRWGLNGYFFAPFEYLSSSDLADDRWVISKVEQ